MAGTVLPAKIQPQLLRPLAYRILSKKFGLNIKSDGLAALATHVGNVFGLNWRQKNDTAKFLELFASIWREQERGLFVDELNVNEVLNEIKERDRADKSQNIVSKTSVPGIKNLDSFLKPKASDSTQVDTSEYSLTTGSKGHDSSMALEGSPLNSEMDHMEIDDELAAFQDQFSQLDWKEYFKMINTFDQQKFGYDHHKRQYKYLAENERNSINIFNSKLKLPTVEDNVNMFIMRYHIVKDRLLRNEIFQSDDIFNPLSSIVKQQSILDTRKGASSYSGDYMKITEIKNLLGHDRKNFMLLGMISENAKGGWSLEDPSGTIELNIEQAIPTKGTYFVPGCILIVEGIYYSSGNVFVVSSITHPPGEKREDTLAAIGNLDLLGIHGMSSPSYISRLDKDLKLRLHYLEEELGDNRFIIMGADIFLDKTNTFDALKKTFDNLERNPPIAIVFFGSFVSIPLHPALNSRNVSATVSYKDNFDTLATLLSDYESLINETQMIFIPGPNDPWASMFSLGTTSMWPQKQIPSSFCGKMNRVCKKIHWGSNPMRIAYLAQEIVLARDDLSARFKRHNVIFPTVEEAKYAENTALQEEFNAHPDLSIGQLQTLKNKLPVKVLESRKIVKTLLDQQHLSPFDKKIRPIVWDLDFALQLSPSPSSLIICDKSAPAFDVTYNSCKTINPGQFIHKRAARYTEFFPATKAAIEEEIPF